MAKEIKVKLKLQAPGGKATPAPPIGPALGAANVNIGQFVQAFNDRTSELNGMIVPVEIFVYMDGSFDFVVKSPPAAVLLKKAAGIESGSGEPNTKKVGTVTIEQCREIAERKMEDLSARTLEAGGEIIAGTARSMGLIVTRE